MNQILKPELNINPNDNTISNSDVNHLNDKKVRSNKIYKLQFVFSSYIAFCFIIAFFLHLYKLNKNEKLSEQLMDSYQISTLYSNSTSYSAQLTNTSSNYASTPFVIGMIKIDKINLNYPILSESSKDLLEISLCRFAGPMPNEPRKSLYCRS